MTAPSPTLQSLLRLGFTEQAPEHGMPCVSVDLPNLPLKCCDGISKYHREVVLVSGVFNDGRSLGEIASEIPQDLATEESAAAWLVYALRDRLGDSALLPDWVALGRANQLLVPAVARQRAYEKRPVCQIDADFARILRTRVDALLAGLERKEALRIRFDGALLLFSVAEDTVQIPARGVVWTGEIIIPDARAFQFPARIFSRGASLDYWQNTMRLGNRAYNAEWVESGDDG